jgi:hypothetical protein
MTTGLLVAAACCAALGSDIPSPREVADVPALVRQLGSEDFAEREEATKRLSTLDVDEVPPELLAALRSPNPEVRDRAAKAVRALREHIMLNQERAAVAHLPRGERFAKLGRIDLFVASTAVSNYKADDDRLWIPAYELGVRAVEKAEMTGDRKPHGGATWFATFRIYRDKLPLRFVRSDEAVHRMEKAGIVYEAIQSAAISGSDPLYALGVSRGPVSAGGIIGSLVLATGDVTSGDEISNTVIICDGDVRVQGNVRTSLIVARGSISIKGTAHSSTLISGGTVTITIPPEPIRRVADPQFQKELDTRKVIIEEKVSKPLGYITFFELSTVGVEVKVADKAVTVAKVAEGQPFAKAGVKAGDVVSAVNGKKPDSAESLRRLLRDALALGDATVTLQRGDKSETVKVALPE